MDSPKSNTRHLHYTFRMKRFALCLLFLLIVLPAFARKADTGFLDRTVTSDGSTYRYQVFVPNNWTKKQKWPVILFLHGSGERGDTGLPQTDVGIGHAIRFSEKEIPFIIVMARRLAARPRTAYRIRAAWPLRSFCC